jgi:type VI secretion system protein ImpK
MREEIANLVHPVLSYGVELRAKLAREEPVDLRNEQAVLRGLLKSDAQAKAWHDFGGDATEGPSSGEGEGGERFLGIRYALVCWLDEIMIVDSPLKQAWSERSLEVALYGTRERAWKFWEQARRAEARARSDALEVFYLCVMLGFRGDLRDKPQQLQAWRDAVETQIAQGHGTEWKGPAELQPPINVPPLFGRQRLQSMMLAGIIALMVFIPVATAFLVYRIGQ